MTGYQEILTDPSYAGQFVVLTYPHIGNVGVNPEDAESDGLHLAGLITRLPPRQPSNWRPPPPPEAYMAEPRRQSGRASCREQGVVSV